MIDGSIIKAHQHSCGAKCESVPVIPRKSNLKKENIYDREILKGCCHWRVHTFG